MRTQKRLALCCLTLALLASGCVEVTETITLNPDGKGKAVLDVVMAANSGGNPDPGPGGFGKKKKEKTLDDIKNEAVAKFLTGNPGVTAWKNVSAKWQPDGRLRVVATAYFDSIAAYSGAADDGKSDNPGGPGPVGSLMPMPHYKFLPGKDGEWKLVQSMKSPTKKKMPPKKLPDPTSLSDKELDGYIFKSRMEYQNGKAIFTAMYADYKHKTVLHLPGKVKATEGFKKAAGKTVTREADGATILKDVHAFMAHDDVFFRKLIRKAGTLELGEDDGLMLQNVPAAADGVVTLRDLGKDQFDYATEMQAARAGNAALRKQFDIGKSMRLPGEARPKFGKN